MRYIFTLCLSFVITVGVNAQQKKVISHEDVWLMKRVGSPQVSPDGKWTIFSVTEPSYDPKETINDVWIVATDGKTEPRRLTTGKAGEGGYSWSPDGNYIAFTAKREADEVSQIYVLNMKEGGDAQRITHLSTGAGSPVWSPDGKKLAFSSSVFPGAMTDSANQKIAAERKARKYNAKVYTGFPIRNWDSWNDDKQNHVFVQDFSEKAIAKDLLAEAQLVKLSGFSAGGLGITWSKDGKEIIFSATENFNESAYNDVINNLYRISINGGEPRKLTTDGNNYGSTQFSKDGKWLYFISNKSIPNSGFEYTQNELGRVSYPDFNKKEILSEKFDRPINRFRLSDDGKSVFLLVENEGSDQIFMLDLTNNKIEQITLQNGGTYSSFELLGKDGLIAGFESATTPTELVRFDLKSKKKMNLTHFNVEKTRALDLSPIKSFWFTSSKGKKIHNFIVTPPNFDPNKKYPLFVFMHGGPHSSFKDNFGYRWNYHLLAQPGYVILMTNYTGSTGYGEKFAQDIQGDPFETPGNEINEAAKAAIKEFSFINETRQAAGGASYGGHLANWLQATTTHYKCLISHAGLVNSEAQWGTSDYIYHREIGNLGPVWDQNEIWRKQNPIRYAANFKTPMLITVGEKDYRVPINNSLENWAVLQRLKIPSKLIVFPTENHWILNAENSRFFYQQVYEWLGTYLK